MPVFCIHWNLSGEMTAWMYSERAHTMKERTVLGQGYSRDSCASCFREPEHKTCTTWLSFSLITSHRLWSHDGGFHMGNCDSRFMPQFPPFLHKAGGKIQKMDWHIGRSQFPHKEFAEYCAKMNISQSLIKAGYPYDNALMKKLLHFGKWTDQSWQQGMG